MKKVLCVVLALAMVFCLAACGDSEQAEENVPAYSQSMTKEGRFNIKASDFVSLPEYKGIDLSEEFWEIDDESVESQISSILANYATKDQITNRAIAFGDQVNIDYSGSIDGVVFDGGTATGQTVTAGGTNFIDDFLTQIIGHLPGDEFDIEVTFPDEYPSNEELAGKDAVFAIKVNYIEESTNPELTDEFVKEKFAENYKVKTVDEFKEYVRTSLLEQQQTTMIDEYLKGKAIVTQVPSEVFDNQEAAVRQNYEDTAASYGIDVDTLISYYGASSLDEVIEESQTQIMSMATDVMIYQAIMEAEGIEVKNTDVADYFEKVSGSRDYSTYQTHYGLPYLKFVVGVEKVNQLIKDSVVKY